jgi:hypothetical protein
VLGAVFTLLLYGLLPLGIVLYLLGTPMRRRALRAAEAQAQVDPAPGQGTGQAPMAPVAPVASAAQPDGSGHAAGDPIPPERKEV